MKFNLRVLLRIILAASISLIVVHCTKKNAKKESQSENNLQAQLKAKAEASKMPKGAKQIMEAAIEELRSTKAAEKALKKGAILPNFSIPDVARGNFNSRQMNKKGPLVLVFYRGSWCPYCNLQLRDLQKRLPEIKEMGAELVAISPEAPDRTAEYVKKEGLDFYVLTDVNSTASRKFGLLYNFKEDLKQVYKGYGLNLEDFNITKKWELPLAATYVVDGNGLIVYSFIDVDYKKRAETQDVIDVLKGLSAQKIMPAGAPVDREDST